MQLNEAIALLSGGVGESTGTWLDLGAGDGLFTQALASLLGPTARVVAIDRDRAALHRLAAAAAGAPHDRAAIEVLEGDYHHLAQTAEALDRVDGALLANSHHFSPQPERVLADLARIIVPGGRILVVEYEGRRANQWVPYPVPLLRLEELAVRAALHAPRVVAERPSRYGGSIYSALLDVPER